MWTTKEIVLFLAGAEAFHTFSHFMMWSINIPPFQYFSITVTPQILLWGGLINAVVTILLLWWASTL